MLYEIDGVPAFRLALYDNSVAYKWKNLIRSIYVGDSKDIDHRRTFYQYKTINEIKKDLIAAIKTINVFLKHEFIQIPINFDQDDYNDLHIKFEKLSGDFDNPTKLMIMAPTKVKESVRDLNYCIHALENFTNDPTTLEIQWTKLRKETPRIPLEQCEYYYTHFEEKENEVYLSYNELGKNFIDLWKDGLSVDYNKQKNKHYIGADIKISFENKKNIFSSEFISWCKDNNIDPYKKTNGIGNLPIGKITWKNTVRLTKNSKIDIIEGVQ
jgi:hypothetical protein